MSRMSELLRGEGYRTTRTEAREAIAPRKSDLQARTLAAIAAAGPAGLTADEVAARIGATVLAVRPRVSELSKEDPAKIEKTGERRANASGLMATVWRAKP